MSGWVKLTEDVSVPAMPNGIWTEACDYVEPDTVLRLSVVQPKEPAVQPKDPPVQSEEPAKATWSYADPVACTADGDLTSLIARARCINDKAPVGALIGKLGGSTAGVADGTVFIVGSSTVVKVGSDGVPLYLTINDELSGMGNNLGSLKVKIERRA